MGIPVLSGELPFEIHRVNNITNGSVKGIRSDVRFGKASRDCAGLGICQVTVNAQTDDNIPTCQKAKALITKAGFGQIAFCFLNDSLCSKSRGKYFHSDHFMLGEPIILPLEVIQMFELKNGIVNTGQYPVFRTPFYTVVVFRAR